jgi:hypothetical protein
MSQSPLNNRSNANGKRPRGNEPAEPYKRSREPDYPTASSNLADDAYPRRDTTEVMVR